MFLSFTVYFASFIGNNDGLRNSYYKQMNDIWGLLSITTEVIDTDPCAFMAALAMKTCKLDIKANCRY